MGLAGVAIVIFILAGAIIGMVAAGLVEGDIQIDVEIGRW